jgi:hypothetical protein
MDGLPGGLMHLAGQNTDPVETMILDVEPDKVLPVRLYVQTDPAGLTANPQTFSLIVDEVDGEERSVVSVKFEAPRD